MIELVSFLIAVALNASADTNINQTSIAFNEWGQAGQSILVFVTFGIVILAVISMIEKIDKDKLFTEKIVLVGIHGTCCNPRSVQIFEDYYQCKKCKRIFERAKE